jgi:hypothetical protein
MKGSVAFVESEDSGFACCTTGARSIFSLKERNIEKKKVNTLRRHRSKI